MIDSSMEITRTFDLLDHLVTKFPDKPDILAGKVNGEDSTVTVTLAPAK